MWSSMAGNSANLPKYDVFIVHSSKDSAKAGIISNALKDIDLIAADHREEGPVFATGRPVYDNIVHAIKHSKIVLILITKHSISSHWVTLETLLALEKSHHENTMRVRLLFEGVSDTDRLKFKQGLLTRIPDITVDFNKEKWTEKFFKQLKEEIPTGKLLPAGNVAHGLVFNYFTGYLAHVLQAISKNVERIEYFASGKFSKKFFIVISESCEVKSLEGKHEDFVIEKMDQVLEMDVTHGDKQRKITLTIYKITKGNEFYYFCADCPFILETMLKMKQMGFADIDLHFQGVRFYMTLKELVEHRSKLEYKNTANFIIYDGINQSSSPAPEIWKSLKSEFHVQVGHETVALHIATRTGIPDTSGAQTFKVTVIYSKEGEVDVSVTEEIIDFLKRHDMKFTSGDCGQMQSEAMDVRWRIFILTETSTKDKCMELEFSTALSDSISKNLVQVIPVLAKGTDLENIPSQFKWATILKQEDPHYLDTMWKAMHENRDMSELLPAGCLHEGLAYSYMINYMAFNLTGKTADGKVFTNRFIDAVKRTEIHCKIIPKVFVIVPSSCQCPPPGTQFENEEHVGPMEPIVMGVRKYFLQLYVLTITKPDKWKGMKVCYAREYATPAIALHDMARLPFAGLSEEEMENEAKQFAKFSNEIMQNDIFNREIGDVRDKCSILYYEDDKHGMAGVTRLLEEQLVQCLVEGRFIEAS